MGVLESERVGRARDQMQLAYLYVSRAYRGRGVGTKLFEAVLPFAREAGARALYVSATPTENTVDFYLNRGCLLTPEPTRSSWLPSPRTSTSSICSDTCPSGTVSAYRTAMRRRLQRRLRKRSPVHPEPSRG